MLITAPAGSGKTSLLTGWIASCSQPVAWLSLDNSENDLVRFFTYFAATLSQHSTSVRQLRDALLALPSLPPATDIGMLMAEAVGDTERLIIVLEDFHHIDNPELHELVSTFINSLTTEAHIVVSSRHDVPLRYVQLWSKGLVDVITAVDLAFSLSEIAQLLAANPLTKKLDPKSIHEQTAGWATGVALSARALLLGQSQHNAQRLTSAFLADEIWRGLPKETREFLLKTSVLTTLKPDLCNTLTGSTSSGARLYELWQNNMFITMYDEETYRYYPIFRDFLLQQLQPQQKVALYEAVLNALIDLNQWDEAAYYAQEIQNEQLLATFALAAAVPMLRQAKLQTLLGLLSKLSKPVILQHPELALWLAWTLFLTGKVSEAHYWMNELKVPLSPSVAGALGALQVVAYSMAGTPESLAVATKAVDACKDSDPIFYATALLSLGQSFASLGESEKAVESFRRAHTVAHMGIIPFAAVVALSNLIYHLYLLGRHHEALQECEWALREYVDETGKTYVLTGFISMMKGILRYSANSLPEALIDLTKGVELSRKLNLLHMIGPGEWHYALALNAAGKVNEANDVVLSLKETALRHKKEGLMRYARALEVELAIIRGDINLVRPWAEEIAPLLQPEKIALPVEHLAYAKALHLVGNTQQSMTVVERLEGSARKQNRKTDLTQLLLLKARIDDRHAPEYIYEALVCAAPENYVRPFIEACPDLTRHISRYAAEFPAFIGNILQYAPQAERKAELYDLSERELELLALVAEGLSNQQIADRLFISVGTTKWHLNNIFSKLGVSRRSEAVARMRELGL